MAYADYEFYTDVYKGAKLSEEDYERYSARADGYLDFVTFGRVRAAEIDEGIQMAACAVAEVCAMQERTLGIRSESAGSYSVSYLDGAFEGAMYGAARRYLDPKLLYRGAR